MAKSISLQVTEFLKSHPAATNTELYQMFPKVRENTLRNYKYKFKNSADQFRNNRKNTRTKKAEKPTQKPASESLRSKVFDFFKENPKATNQSLYEAFSNYSKNKLRHYKASFFKSAKTDNRNSKTTGRKTAEETSKALSTKKQTPRSLEQRMVDLEAQVEKLSDLITHKSDAKTAFSGTAENIEKKVRELEDTISSFINTKRKKIKAEMSHLEEIQQVVSDKIGSFIKGFK